MSLDKTDVIFNPAVSSDYCIVTVASINGAKTFIVVVVKEGEEFPESINYDKDIFLEVEPEGEGKITVSDIFNTITEARVLSETYLPVRIRVDLYSESQEFFADLFTKVITSQYDDFPLSTCKH